MFLKMILWIWDKKVPLLVVFAPIVVSYYFVLYSKDFLEEFEVNLFITISSWFFSLISVIFIFIVWKKFDEPLYNKEKREKNYLDKEGIEDLKVSVSYILKFSDDSEDITHLSEHCRTVKYIYDKLSNKNHETELDSLSEDIKSLIHLLNKHKLETIGASKNKDKWNKIDIEIKSRIGKKAFYLEKDLESLLSEIKKMSKGDIK